MKLQADRPAHSMDESDKGIFEMLERLDIHSGSKWYALILFMRSIKDFDIYNAEQKSRIQLLVMQVLMEHKLDEETFQDICQKIEEILSLPWRMRLQEALGEISRLIRESRSLILRRKGDLEVLETNTVETLQSGRDLEAVIDDIRLGFQDVVRLMEKDADDLVRQSRTDQLTGLGNRRAFDEVLERAVESALGSGQPLHLLMADVDHFKAFNDNHGHLIGDQALAAVASVLRDGQKQAARNGRNVFCSRFGGEEFAVLVAGGGQSQALHMAELIRKHIENYNFVIRDVGGGILTSGIKLTVSLGVGTLDPAWKDNLARRLIQAADQALYQAKNSGRNRVCLSGPKD